MIHKSKVLGLAFVAVAAMSVAAVPAAQASELHATFAGNVSILGSNTAQHSQHVFTTAAGSIKCTQSLFEGTAPYVGGPQVTAQELTLTGRYTGCTGFGLAATLDMSGCKYTVTNKHSVTGHTTALTAYVDITGCTTGKTIEVTMAGPCLVTFPEQHNLGHIVFSNNPAASPHDVTANFTVTGITYEAHGTCPVPPTVLMHDGQYAGQATFQAHQDKGVEQLTSNGHQYERLKPTGALVGLLAT
jgi:hypothetical protein